MNYDKRIIKVRDIKMMEKKNKGEAGFFKSILMEIRDSIILEVIWNIIVFFPRVLVRLWKHFY
ncbi:hypothetical protein [Psychrobacillus vulpis]|uniref:Uncharacterized protein n=1 Tax=Psychrobacillus vulpis TaxID=2325572 RepID=A0A544TNH8_9BACI|nr:hypothetical protein [Psychrobacillus vulpis]TQR19000.1 hypothetical protein FG384_14350 [Psychrobacillus vulpis]